MEYKRNVQITCLKIFLQFCIAGSAEKTLQNIQITSEMHIFHIDSLDTDSKAAGLLRDLVCTGLSLTSCEGEKKL